MKKQHKKNTASAAPGGLFGRLAELYARMQEAYRASAAAAGLSCDNCPTNCCTSYFRHHTYVEWAYLWRGLSALPPHDLARVRRRAKEYLEEAGQSLSRNMPPSVMCPLNEGGLCALYPYRLMICRMHGTRNAFTRPDGQSQIFPGCDRFITLPCANDPDCPSLDRTPFYRDLAALEMEFYKRAGRQLPRVDITLAEMIVLGPPQIT
jgi:hypothetical protein